jgi:hypothetical protein
LARFVGPGTAKFCWWMPGRSGPHEVRPGPTPPNLAVERKLVPAQDLRHVPGVAVNRRRACDVEQRAERRAPSGQRDCRVEARKLWRRCSLTARPRAPNGHGGVPRGRPATREKPLRRGPWADGPCMAMPKRVDQARRHGRTTRLLMRLTLTLGMSSMRRASARLSAGERACSARCAASRSAGASP